MSVAHDVPVVPSPAVALTLPTVSPASSPAPRTWLRRIAGGGQIYETCPTWCTDSHFNDKVGCLDDLSHGAYFDGPDLAAVGLGASHVPMPILSGRLSVDPYSDDLLRNVPHIDLEPVQDEALESLTPAEFAAVIAQVRAHCDRMEAVHAQLVAARAEHGQMG